MALEDEPLLVDGDVLHLFDLLPQLQDRHRVIHGDAEVFLLLGHVDFHHFGWLAC